MNTLSEIKSIEIERFEYCKMLHSEVPHFQKEVSTWVMQIFEPRLVKKC